MSVTITIENNAAYCEAHGMAESSEVDCLCKMSGADNCSVCGGTGKELAVRRAYEIRLSNRFFKALWDAMDVPVQYEGTADGRSISSKLFIYCERRKKQPANCKDDPDDGLLSDYALKLLQLCEEAQKREERVVWG